MSAECRIDVCTDADGCGSVPFYLERTGWPLVHATTPAYLYFVTRKPILSLLLIFVWEVVELLLSIPFPYLAEHRYDSLIGDPLIGGLSILILYSLDAIFDWQRPFCATYSPTRRTIAFFVVALLTPLLALDDNVFDGDHINGGALIFGAIVSLFTLIYFLCAPQSDDTATRRVVRLNVLFVAGYILAMTAAVAYRSDDECSLAGSAFLRVLFIQLTALFLALLAFPALWTGSDTHSLLRPPVYERSGREMRLLASGRDDRQSANDCWRALVGHRDVSRLYEIEAAPFWREPATFPFAHAVVPLALYFTTRNILLSLLLIYVWETIETLISLLWPYFREKRLDSLLGDPLVGSLGIFAFAFLDEAFGWRDAFRDFYGDSRGIALRTTAFAAAFLGSALLTLDRGDAVRIYVHFGVAFFTALYVGVFLAIFSEQFEESGVLALLTYVVVLGFIVFVRGKSLQSLSSSIFLRVVATQAVFALVSLLIWLVE